MSLDERGKRKSVGEKKNENISLTEFEMMYPTVREACLNILTGLEWS